jgi:cholera toxin transcriptional activator
LVVGKRRWQTLIANDERLTTNDCLAVHYGRAVMPMPSSNREARLLRFGVFEVDLAAGELRKNGARIRLQEQPFQVLTALLQNAGQVVTRDELREKIWPADTFVDFDHSLNTAVNKIRESLGDSASSPRFVETLARRGYRFIAPVDSVATATTVSTPAQDKGTRAGAPAPHGLNDPATSPVIEIALHPELHVPVPRRGLVRALFALIQVMYLIFYVNGLAHLHAVDRIASSFLPGWRALFIVGAVLVTGAVGIPLRFYLLSAVAFDFRKLGRTFGRLFPFVLALDQLWAIAPFLLLPQIGVGLAFAATAALLYVPFSERTLVRLAYRER